MRKVDSAKLENKDGMKSCWASHGQPWQNMASHGRPIPARLGQRVLIIVWGSSLISCCTFCTPAGRIFLVAKTSVLPLTVQVLETHVKGSASGYRSPHGPPSRAQTLTREPTLKVVLHTSGCVAQDFFGCVQQCELKVCIGSLCAHLVRVASHRESPESFLYFFVRRVRAQLENGVVRLAVRRHSSVGFLLCFRRFLLLAFFLFWWFLFLPWLFLFPLCFGGFLPVYQKSAKIQSKSRKINQNSILEGLGAICAPQVRFGTDLDASLGSTWGRF